MNATMAFYNDLPTATETSNGKPLVVVPEGVVQNRSVFLVFDKRARKRAVTTAGTSAKGVLVANGLNGGEELIQSPPADLKDVSEYK